MAMDVQDFALRIVTSPSLTVKLAPPRGDLLDSRGTFPVPDAPARAPELEIRSAREAAVPKSGGWPESRLRRRILHALVNHELQAVELYARAILLFPDAPADFRSDLLHVLLEEQRHTRSYQNRLEAIGGRVGEHPVSGYFWNKAPLLSTPLEFISAMSLTFENANLDHTLENRRIAAEAGDVESVDILDAVHRDEMGHVAFGWRWLRRLSPTDISPWQAYTENLRAPLHPGRASGRIFRAAPRRAAGLDEEFVANLERAHHERATRVHARG